VGPVHIHAAETEWRVPGQLEFFVDFETVSNLKDDFARRPEQAASSSYSRSAVGISKTESGSSPLSSAATSVNRSEAETIDAWIKHLDEVRR
jgi:hypothetical protein